MNKQKIFLGNEDLLRLPLLFLAARLILFLSLPQSGLQSYGDFWNFFHIAQLGTPFIDNWVEFPPVFPFISRLVFLLTSGRQHAYEYLLAIIFSVFQALSIYVIQLIALEIYPREKTKDISLQYTLLLVGLFYGWAYFDPLAVFTLLLGMYYFIRKKEYKASLIIGIGTLVKLFPILMLVSAWKWREGKNVIKTIIIVLALIVVVYGSLYLIAPENTLASLLSQGNKGSWETVWAMIDGNWGTGNFNPEINRLDYRTAYLPSGNPPVISPWITLVVICCLGFAVFIYSKVKDPRQFLALTAFTLIMFFLWSPGYSPQWVLYLLPFILLCLESLRRTLISLTFILINLAEWPVLLSRGGFQYLGGLILIRTLLLVVLAWSMLSILFEPLKKDRTQ
jgi:Gpi18-like mannosyltransferase